MCTHNETLGTTTSITAVSPSTYWPSSMCRGPTVNQPTLLA